MWGSKLGAVVLLAAVGVVGAYIPIVLRKCKIERFVCVLNTFAAGAFLGLALFHIMPEAAQTLEKEEIFIYVGRFRTPFNLAFLLIFIGYVVILLCEQVFTINEGDDNGTSPGESEPASPPDAEAEREARWRWGGGEGEQRHRRRGEEALMEVVVISAPAAAAAKYDCELGENVGRPRAARAAVEAAAAEAAAAAADSGTAQGDGEASLNVSVVDGDETALTRDIAKDMSANEEAAGHISSYRRESLSGDDTRGGGCGLGYPCCLMAAAAAREAARKQLGGGSATETGGEAGTVQTECLEKYDIDEDELKGQKKTSFALPCCVLQQRQKHPRDSTRASAAGSDTDEIEHKDAISLPEAVDPLVSTREVRVVEVCEGFCAKKEFRGDSVMKNEMISLKEGLQLQERKEGMLVGGGMECEGREGAETQEQSCPPVNARPPTVAANVPSLGVCRSSSSTTLYHPPGQRDCYCVSACKAAAATRDTATNDVACGEIGVGRTAATGGGEGGRERNSVEVAIAVRDILQGDKFALELGQAGQGDCRGETRDQEGYVHRWWGGLWRRRGSRQLKKKEEKDVERTRRRWRFSCCRWCPSRFLSWSLPLSKQVNGGAFFLMAALAIHGLFEGFVVGAESNFVSLWIITSVIAAHKWAESLLLMAQFMERHLSAAWAWLLMSIFVASSPLGIIIGACLSSENRVAAGVCNALGAGTLLFVAAEVSTKVFTGERKHRLLQLLVYCAGAGMVFALNLLDIALE